MNAKKLLSTLLSAAMAVSMLAGCFGGGGNKNYSDEAADAANAAQSTVVFATDAKLSKSLQDALENFTQLDDIKDAMEADERDRRRYGGGRKSQAAADFRLGPRHLCRTG